MSAAGFDWLIIDPINSPLSQIESFAIQTAVGDGNPTPVLMRVGGPTDRSGVQHVEAVSRGDARSISAAVLPVKFGGGALAIGAGLALGREGPTVHVRLL